MFIPPQSEPQSELSQVLIKRSTRQSAFLSKAVEVLVSCGEKDGGEKHAGAESASVERIAADADSEEGYGDAGGVYEEEIARVVVLKTGWTGTARAVTS